MEAKKYGRLTALGEAKQRKQYRMMLCQCDCGNVVTCRRSHLRSGATKSCGCLLNDKNRERQTHGEAANKSPEWRTWVGMRKRCLTETDKAYRHYGGRGINICARWSAFENFLADMGRKPSPDHSIDRIDNDGNYEPGNCRWATRLEQSRNKRTTILSEDVAIQIRELANSGVSKAEISRSLNVHYSSVKQVAARRQWA